MPQTIIDLLKNGAQANLTDEFRHGNVIMLPDNGRLIITGDLHGHRRNFERVVTFADLANNPDTYVVFQEIIHGGPADSMGGCMSYKLLFDIIHYKLSFPKQVFIIMGNHDTAFINDSEVMKDGREMNRALNMALEREFKQAGKDIILSIKNYLFSQPLAIKCDNRIWISHSLPADRFADKFDPSIMDRELKPDDLVKPGSVYLLTWGRKMSQQLLDKMAKMFDVDLFVLGHQSQEQGWFAGGSNLLIIDSNHNHGRLVSIDLSKPYTLDMLIEALVPIASIL